MKLSRNALTTNKINHDEDINEFKELFDFINENEMTLIQIIFAYVKRANVWKPHDWLEVAKEIWSATKQTALEKASKLEVKPQLKAWLLKTSNNHLLRERSKYLETITHEESINFKIHNNGLNELEIFDRLVISFNKAGVTNEELNQCIWQSWKENKDSPALNELISREGVKNILSPLNDGEKIIFLLAKLYDLNGEEIGKILNIKPEAARQRISRALAKLRDFHIEKGT